MDLDDFNIQPVYDWHSTIVYAMRPHNVLSVYVDGHPVVKDRRMTGFDQDEVASQMRRISGNCADYIARIS